MRFCKSFSTNIDIQVDELACNIFPFHNLLFYQYSDNYPERIIYRTWYLYKWCFNLEVYFLHLDTFLEKFKCEVIMTEKLRKKIFYYFFLFILFVLIMLYIGIGIFCFWKLLEWIVILNYLNWRQQIAIM